MRWWPWEVKREVTIKVDGLERIKELEEEREFLFKNYKMQRDDNYRILENRALREKLKAQKQATKEVRRYYRQRIEELNKIITDLDFAFAQERGFTQRLQASLAVLKARPCNHIGTTVSKFRVGNVETIQVANEEGRITWQYSIQLEAASGVAQSQETAGAILGQSSVAVPGGSEPAR